MRRRTELLERPRDPGCLYCGRDESTLIRARPATSSATLPRGAGADLIRRMLASTTEPDPVAILEGHGLPGLPMHGAEHHGIVPA